MVRYIITVCLTLSVAAAAAQSKKVIYYKNGKKAIEGSWKIVSSRMEHATSLLNLLMDEDRFSESKSMKNFMHSESFDDFSLLMDGTFIMYNPNGSIHRKGNYKNGVPDGQSESYYNNGQVLAKGKYKDGMPDGQWIYNYPDGKRKVEVVYAAYRQSELDSFFGLKMAKPKIVPAKDFEAFYSRSAFFSTEIDHVLKQFTRNLSVNAKLNGPVIFYKQSGEKEAELQYKDGLPEGDNIFYEQGVEKMRAVFRKGLLTALYNGEKENLLEGKGVDAEARAAALFGKKPRLQPEDVSAVDPGIVGEVAPGKEVPMAEDQVFRYVEQMPEFPGDINKYLSQNIQYPGSAIQAGIEGRVSVQFVVRADGSIDQVKVVRGIDTACDTEAVRVISGMPRWKPGKQNGRAVPVYYTLPVSFKLSAK